MPRNQGYEYREQVGAAAHGQRLVDYLARRYRHSSAATWRRRIDAGELRIEERPASPDSRLARGQLVSWRRPGWDEPDVPASFGVLVEDAELIAVAKPAGLPTLPGAGYLQSTLLHRVRALWPRATPVHRLGRWTSGVVLFARTPGARADLARQWADRGVGKHYRALAGGSPRGEAFVVGMPIGRLPHPVLGTVHAACAAGKPATSRVRVVERRAREFLCDVEIPSGRPHQIRIHLAAAGHPLVGDPLYADGGVPPAGCRALPGEGGYLLHATGLDFRHPRTGRRVIVRCAPPPPLRPGTLPLIPARTSSSATAGSIPGGAPPA